MNNLEFNIKKTDLSKDDKGNNALELGIKSTDAMILHPSFCCPVVVEEGKPITIFLLTGSDFYDMFAAEVEARPIATISIIKLVPTINFEKVVQGTKGGGFIKRHINQMLNFQHWEQDLMCVPPQKPIYDTFTDAQNNIEVTYLDELKEPCGLKDKSGIIFANMRESSFKKYVQDEGFKYLFQVELWRADNLSQGLYDLSWITKNDNVFDDFSEKEKEAPSDTVEFYEKQDQITRKYICEDEKRKGFTHAYKIGDEDNDFEFEFDPKAPIQNHHPVYVVEKGKKKLNIGHLSDVHVSSKQFAYQTCKAKVIPGCEDSPEIGSMVNISFYTLRDLMDSFGKDADIDLLIFTGDLIDHGRNYNPKSKFINNPDAKTGDIWDQMTLDNIDKKFEDGEDAGKEMYPHSIDNVLVYSLFRRYYKKYKKPILLVSGNHECYTLPYGISPRADMAAGAKSTIRSIPYIETITGAAAGAVVGGIPGAITGGAIGYSGDTQKKPMTIEQIIQEANERRKEDWLKRTAKESEDKNIDRKRANEGIPADNNLTIYEAILMYGPDYNMVPMSGFTDNDDCKNFKPENLNWFYNIFTPLEDFVISYNNQQNFIGLGWKDRERFISLGSMRTFGGLLPRAPEAVTNEQLELIKTAVKKESGDNILLSHFTFANYAASKGIESEGEINYNDSFKSDSDDCCTGTFESNRYEVYKMIVCDKKIKYTLSGHSHRNGIYICTDSDSSWLPGRYYFKTQTIPLDMQSLEYDEILDDELSSCTKMIVSSSGGNIGKQNFNNELFNWSIDYPSGTSIKYDNNDKEMIKIVRAEKAKPRFAVALEYADIVGRDQLDKDAGIFKYIKLSEYGNELELEINSELDIPLNDEGFIQQISLYINKGINQEFAFKYNNTVDTSKFTVIDIDTEDLEEIFESDIPKLNSSEFNVFLSLKLKQISDPCFNYYDFEKPLNIRSQIISVKQRMKEILAEKNMQTITGITYNTQLQKRLDEITDNSKGYLIERDPAEGEVVNHAKLSKSGGSDFAFDWKKHGGSTVED